MQTEDTQSWFERLSQEEAEECLVSLQGLTNQLHRAMDAIVTRKLPLLQDSLHHQQATCDRLEDLKHRSNDRFARGSEPETTAIDSDLAEEIKAATATLLTLNSRYSVLLKYSGETLRLLSGLYRSYRGFAQPASGIQSSLQTWSCEV